MAARGDLDQVSLYEGLVSTRAIRRYTDERVPDEALRDILFAATRAPSGSNRQPFRFIVLTDGPVALEAKRLIGEGARRFWAAKREADGYDKGSGADTSSPKARMARTMQHYVDNYESVPVLILACYVPYRQHRAASDAASMYPACQNLLLAARALGYGGVMTGWQAAAAASAARAARTSPTTSSSWRRSPSGARRGVMVRCADVPSRNWSSGSSGSSHPPGRSTPKA